MHDIKARLERMNFALVIDVQDRPWRNDVSIIVQGINYYDLFDRLCRLYPSLANDCYCASPELWLCRKVSWQRCQTIVSYVKIKANNIYDSLNSIYAFYLNTILERCDEFLDDRHDAFLSAYRNDSLSESSRMIWADYCEDRGYRQMADDLRKCYCIFSLLDPKLIEKKLSLWNYDILDDLSYMVISELDGDGRYNQRGI